MVKILNCYLYAKKKLWRFVEGCNFFWPSLYIKVHWLIGLIDKKKYYPAPHLNLTGTEYMQHRI